MRVRLFLLAFLFTLAGFEMPQRTVIPDGAYGVWQVPSVSVNAPLYTSQGDDQAVVDAEDSALIRKWGDGTLICDHANSQHGDAAWNVNEFTVGEAAFLIRYDTVESYRCTAIYLARDTGRSYTYEGREIWPKKHDVICVSCAAEPGTVYVAYYDHTGDVP